MKKFKTAAFIGSYATGTIHQMFDTAFLHSCAVTFEHVDCYKDKTTFPFIEEMGASQGFTSNVTLHSINVVKSKNKVTELWHFIKSALINVCLLFKLKQDVIVFAYNNLFALHLINFLNKLLHKRIIICAHGELEYLVSEEGGKFAKVNRLILRNFFLHKTIQKNVNFLVLGDSIYNNLKDLLPQCNIDHFYSIDHPCYMNESFSEQGKKDGTIKFGLLGTLSAIKGMNLFKSFVTKLYSVSHDKYSVSIIGRINTHEHDAFLKDNNVDVTWSYLSRKEFEDRISSCDCILFFYPPTSYKLIASGTILDAISMRKPVLALRNDFFEYIINRANYPAILCDNIDEMIEIIQTGELSDVYDKGTDMNRGVFSPQNVSKQLEAILIKAYGFDN